MVTAVVHGNELCGAIVLDELMRVRPVPKRGRLTLAFVNVAAYQSFEAGSPTSSRFVDEDFNRLWSAAILDGPRDSVELRRARALKPVVDTVDVLLDIHSMQHPTAPLTMAGPLAKGRRLAEAVGCTELVVTDAGHAAGQRLRDYAAFADPDSARNALLVECGQHWQRASSRRGPREFGAVPGAPRTSSSQRTGRGGRRRRRRRVSASSRSPTSSRSRQTRFASSATFAGWR